MLLIIDSRSETESDVTVKNSVVIVLLGYEKVFFFFFTN